MNSVKYTKLGRIEIDGVEKTNQLDYVKEESRKFLNFFKNSLRV